MNINNGIFLNIFDLTASSGEKPKNP